MILMDGHNALHRLYDLTKENFLASQGDLISRIRVVAEARKKDVCVVFDGSGGGSSFGRSVNEGPRLRVVHSGSDRSADDWIIAKITANSKEDHVLISDDLELFRNIHQFKVTRNSPAQWLNDQEKQSRSRQVKRGGKTEFGSTAYWLKEFS